jgi:acyl carrier protein
MSNKENLTNEIMVIVKNLTKSNNIDKNSTQDAIAQWDSLAYMSIISEIELKYAISITQENFMKFSSIQSIVNLIYVQD